MTPHHDEDTFAVVPARPSNRRVIEQAKGLGCTAHTKGATTTLVTPTGRRVKVFSPGTNVRGTTHEQLAELYEALDLGPAEFWTAPRPPQGQAAGFVLPAQPVRPMGALVAAVHVLRQLLDEEEVEVEVMVPVLRAIAEAGVGTESEEWAAGFGAYADEMEAEQETDQEEIRTMLNQLAAAEQDPEPDHPSRARADRGASTRVLEYLIDRGEPRSTDQVSRDLGMARGTAASAGNYLVRIGAANRIKAGVWQATARRDPDAVVGVEVSVVEEEPPERPLAAVLAHPARLPASEYQEPALPTVDSIDEEVETVLDLLFPDGMTLRAADVRRVVAWTEATKALLREVRS